MFKLVLTAFLASTVLVSCAKLEVLKVKNPDDFTDGVRFYRPAPYLFVTAVLNEKGELTKTTTAQILWLPDKSEEYQVRAVTGLGSVELSPTLTDGWNLTALSAKADSKTAENITALAALLTAASGGKGILGGTVSGDGKINPFLAPGLYPLVFEGGKIVAIGRPIELVREKPEKPPKETEQSPPES
jgi:hypothetical protein